MATRDRGLSNITELVASDEVGLKQEIRTKPKESGVDAYGLQCSPLEDHLRFKEAETVRVKCPAFSSGQGC